MLNSSIIVVLYTFQYHHHYCIDHSRLVFDIFDGTKHVWLRRSIIIMLTNRILWELIIDLFHTITLASNINWFMSLRANIIKWNHSCYYIISFTSTYTCMYICICWIGLFIHYAMHIVWNRVKRILKKNSSWVEHLILVCQNNMSCI